jgi:peptide/nickel transport system permease protein
MDMTNRLAGPNARHWLGTDNFGRDLWARMVYGARVSLAIGFTSVALASVVGVVIGITAGYFRGWIDLILMRLVDLFLGFPPIILALAVVAILGPGTVNVIVALTAVMWTQYARVMRSIATVEAERDYVLASRALGFAPSRIIVRQILPNTFGPVVVLAALGVGTAIVAESGLSFLGFGVQPPTPTWGWTLAYGVRFIRSAAWLSIVPGLFITCTVLGFNLVGDGFRDFLDPHKRLTVTPLSNR